MLSPLILTAQQTEIFGTANRPDAVGGLIVWSARARDLVPHLTEQTTEVQELQPRRPAYTADACAPRFAGCRTP